MKKILLCLMGLILLVYLPPSTYSGETETYSKVKNGGFEQLTQGKLSYWTIRGQKDAIHIDQKVYIGGEQSVLVDFSNRSMEGTQLEMTIEVEAYKRYDFAGNVKTENLNDGYAQLFVQFYDRDKNKIEKVTFSKMSGTNIDWEEFHEWVESPEGADTAQVVCYAKGLGKAWFDDIRFTGKLQGGY
jgi:hypothetical protein